MIKRLNFTGRKRISRDHVQVRLDESEGNGTAFTVVLDLSNYKLPRDARVFVEAYRQTTFARFAWGTVGNRQAPVERSLATFGTMNGVLFRVKVVDVQTQQADALPRVLASIDRIQPLRSQENVKQVESLLPIVPADIREVWRVRFDDGNEPMLEINKSLVPNAGDLSRSAAFLSLVLPEVFRSVLTRILLINEYEDSEDSSSWESSWLRFATKSINTSQCPHLEKNNQNELSNRAEIEEWIDSAVDQFTDQTKIASRFREWWREGDDA